MPALPGALVSVIVPVYNEEAFLGEALASAKAQSYWPVEVIVVDDGSEDATAAVASACGVTVLRCTHRGAAAARNTGIRASSGAYWTILDGDDVMPTRRLAAQVAYLEESPVHGMVLGLTEAFVTPGEPVPAHYNPAWDTGPFSACAGTLLARRGVFDTVGPFDESLEVACDVDWLARAKDLGVRSGQVEELCLRYRIHAGNRTADRPPVHRAMLGILRNSVHRQQEAVAPSGTSGSSPPAPGPKGALAQYDFYSSARREHGTALARAGLVERYLDFAGQVVRFRVAGAALAEQLLPALAGRPALPGPHLGAASCIEVWQEGSCPSPLPVPWHWEDVGPGGVVKAGALGPGATAVHETCSNTVALLPTGQGPVLYRVRNIAALPWWELAAPLRPALSWALGRTGGQLVHAGALACDAGAVVLVGPKGSGKTTAVLAGLAAGMRLVSDDYVLLQASGAPARVVPIYTVTSQVQGEGDGPKRVVRRPSEAPQVENWAVPVRSVVVPRPAGGPTVLSRTSAAVALRAWGPTTVFQMPAGGGAVLSAMKQVLEKVPCFALSLGDDPAEVAAALLSAAQGAP